MQKRRRSIRVDHYESWHAYKNGLFPSLCGTDEPQVSRFLFRGQRDPSWKLVPSFYRHFGQFTEDARRIALQTLLSRFEKYCQAEPTLRQLFETENDNQRIAFAQHSGLPTDLLDWTESPYVAAFFAASDFMQAQQVTPEISVWVIDTFHPIWLAGHRKAQLPPPFTVPGWHNTRLRSQRGWFTVLDPKFTAFDDWVLAHKGGEQALRQCVVKLSNGVEPLLIELQLMGISHSSLFPDPGGWANAAFLDTLLRLRQTSRMPHSYPWSEDAT